MDLQQVYVDDFMNDCLVLVVCIQLTADVRAGPLHSMPNSWVAAISATCSVSQITQHYAIIWTHMSRARATAGGRMEAGHQFAG